MKKILLSILALCAALLANAQFPGMGRVEYKTMPSRILGVEREYAIYLPPSYEQNTGKSYPVLYLLHGGGGSHTDWPKVGRLSGIANQMIAAGDACEMIVVCPEAGKNFMNFFNCPEWRYQDYFFEELIPYIDANYRTVADKEHRAVAGLSMGGGATVVYAATHPELFAAAYSMSGYFYRHDHLFWIDFNAPVQKKIHQLVEDNNCVKLIQNASEKQVEDLKTVRWFVDCGDDDFTYDANIAFVAALREKQIPYQLRVRDGGHTWEYWTSALYLVLPFVSNSFAR